jgi:RHS repeat-associated protein/uncharacterized repeat protein (TIGR01451 family)
MLNTRRVASVAAAVIAAGAAVLGALQADRFEQWLVAPAAEEADLLLSGTPSVSTFPDGTRLFLDTELPVTLPDGSLQLDARLWLEPITTPTEAVVFTIDQSGSALVEGEGCGGDFNADGFTDTVLDCELASTLAAIQEIGAWGTVDEVAIVLFELLSATTDIQPEFGFQTFTVPLADLNGDGVLDAETVLRSVGRLGLFSIGAREFSRVSVRFGFFGGTNFELAAAQSCQALSGSTRPNRTIVFLSDGEANFGNPVATVLPCAEPAVIQTVAVGPQSSCTSDSYGLGSLADIAALGGGVCTQIVDPSDLAGVLSSAVVPQITSVTLSVDGGPPEDISDRVVPEVPHRGAGELQLSTVVPEGAEELCVTVTAVTGSSAPVTVTECVGATPQTPPVADAGPDQIVVEGERVVLDGSASSDPDGDPLTYSWSLSSLDGPPLVIAGGAGPIGTVQTLDDGRYTFELTVSDGVHSATDTVDVSVTNAAPEAMAQGDGAGAGGVALITAQLTDAGVIDTHAATVDWGDGTPVEPVPVSAQGTGWASLFASHVYPTAGTRTATVTVSDDDGDTDVVTVDLSVAPVVAMWADGTSGNAIDWTGGGGNVTGLVHSNAGLRLNGQEKTIVGGAEYVTTATLGNQVTVDPPATQVPISPNPIDYDLSAFAPGGAAAVQAGADFHDMSGACGSGRWDVQSALAPGLYHAPCGVKLWSPQAEVTIVATGEIDVVSQGTNLRPFVDGLVLGSTAAGAAIDIASSDGTWLGHLVAPSGLVDLSGATNTVLCGILASEIDLSGSGLEVHGSDCVRPQQTNAPPVLVPLLQLGLAQTPATPLPGEPVTAALTVTNDQAQLLVPGIVGLENHGATPVTITGATVALEALEVATGTWTSVPTTLLTRSNAAPGVTYGADPVGTSVDGGALASWGAELQATLPAATVAWLIDEAQVAAVRTVVDFEVDDAAAPVRSLYRFGDDLAPALRAQGSVAGVEITLTTLDGATRMLTSTDDPALAEVGPGDVVALAVDVAAPVPAPVGPEETAEAYLGRLAALDGRGLGALASGRGTTSLGPALAPQVFASSALTLPILEPVATVPAAVTAGATLSVPVDLASTGSADAVAASGSVSVDGASDALALPAVLVPGQLADDTAEVQVPAALAGSFADVVTEVSWSDDLGGLYGPVTLQDLVFVDLEPALSALLTGVLAADADGNGVLTSGDTIELTATVRNGGSAPLAGVALSVPLDPGAPLVGGSAQTTLGAVTRADTVVEVAIGSLPGFGMATVRWQAVLGAVSSVSHQGTVTSAALPAAPTDDPAVSGSADPTITHVVPVQPTLLASLSAVLLVDADLDHVASAGDTIRYLAGVHNPGLTPVDAVQLSVTPGAGVSLVVGSAVTDGGGTVVSGNTSGETAVAVDFGTIPAFGSPAAVFDVTVTGAPGIEVVTQGSVTATGLALVTDDPSTMAPDDPTRTMIGGSSVGIPGAPVVEVASPVDGGRVGAPVDVVATATPEAGAAVASWEVVAYAAGTDPLDGTVLGAGVGGLPGVLGTFDPTLLQNGLWQVRVEVTDDLGRTGVSEASLEVAGEMKLGSFDVAFLEAEWHASVTPISLVRSYSTLRKDVVGDFGHGWALEMLDFTVQSNGPLGAQGWSQQGCGTGFLFAPVCTTSTRPHLVAVRWPDGNVEAFDLTPNPGNTFFSPITTVSYTPRAGATSVLEPVAGDETIFVASDGNLYTDLTLQEVYEPQRYWLTDRTGQRWLLDIADGLVETIDRNGNGVEFGPDGIFPDAGFGVSFVRDTAGRIDKILLADGHMITYRYNAAGDLAEVEDQLGHVAVFDYDSGHRLTSYSAAAHSPIAVVTYDADGRMASKHDSLGVLVEQASDPMNFTTTTSGPDPDLTTTRTFDANGMLVEKVQTFDGTLRRYGWHYDQEFHLIQRELPGGGIATLERDDRGRITREVDPDGVVRQWAYDVWSNVTEARVAGRVESTWTHDEHGNEIERRSGTGDVLEERTWTPFGGLATWQDADGRQTTFQYDEDRLLVGALVDGQSWTIETDDLGRIVAVTDPSGARVEAVLDGRGRTVELVDANGHRERWTHDARGFRVSHTDKLGASATWTYDDGGHLLSRTTRSGAIVSYTRDAAGRISEITAGDAFVRFTRDPLGRVLSAENEDHLVEQNWSLDGDLVSSLSVGVGPSVSAPLLVMYTYSPGGRLEVVETPFGVRTVAYDLEGRTSVLFDEVTGITTTWSFGPDGEASRLERSSGLVTQYSYSPALRLEETVSTAGGAVVQSTSMVRDADGWVDEIVDLTGVHHYAWDARGQLLSADHPAASGIADELYAYDPNGNRTAWAGHPPTEVRYDAADRLLQDAVYAYAWDPDGRLVSRTERSSGAMTIFGWNDFDQLVSVDSPDGTTTGIFYDPLGRRVEVVHDGVVERLLFDGRSAVAVLDDADQLTYWRSRAPGGALLAEWSAASGSREALLDHLGTVVGWHDATGFNLVSRDSFGKTPGTPSRVEPGALTWHDADPTGLIAMAARTYDPLTGRFLSEDPVPSGNRYTYALNNPLSFWDPDGCVTAPEYNAVLQGPATGVAAGAPSVGTALRATLYLVSKSLPLVYVRPTPHPWNRDRDRGDDDDDDDDDDDPDCDEERRQAWRQCVDYFTNTTYSAEVAYRITGVRNLDTEANRQRCIRTFLSTRCGGG